MKSSLGSLAALAALSLPAVSLAQPVLSSFENLSFANAPLALDLDGDHTTDFTLYANDSAIVLEAGGSNLVARHHFGVDDTILFNNGTSTTFSYDLDPAGSAYYVGVKFDIASGAQSGFHTGWLQIDLPSSNYTDGVLVSGGWNATAGASIAAGAGVSAVPEPATTAAALGLLGGVFAFFRRRLARSRK